MWRADDHGANPAVTASTEVERALSANAYDAGKVIGSTTSRLPLLRPKNWYRWTANAAMVSQHQSDRRGADTDEFRVRRDLPLPSLSRAAAAHPCR